METPLTRLPIPRERLHDRTRDRLFPVVSVRRRKPRNEGVRRR
ncbi:MAG: hypothetical protein OEU35_07630 [Desulfuromonadales bacterium]|nr:hypothetical protein [Desulfuromonadales bacterium]